MPPILTHTQASDSSLPLNQAQTRNGTGANSIIPAKRAVPAVVEKREENPLKRKRDKPKDEAENPKLKEFLQVMQKPSKKSWQDEGGDLQGRPVGEIEPLQSIEVEAKSDDEYETIISKKSKKESKYGGGKEELEQSAGQNSDIVRTPDATELEGDPPSVPPVVVGDSNEAKSDTDWLRSRTNRLLDLVDDDEETTRPTPKPTAQNSAADEPVRKPESAETEAPAQDEEIEGETVNADEEAVRLSRRLFLRNLSYGINEDDLRTGFTQFGSLEEVRRTVFHTLLSLVMNLDRDNLCKLQLMSKSETDFSRCLS
jgi:multiple RNA-binding domain-containing protein 1